MSLIDSRTRALGGLIAAATLLLATPAWAADEVTEPVVADGLIVVRDAETGQLRAPTAEEAAAMSTARSAAANTRGKNAAGTFLSKTHSSGAIGARVTDEMASYSVVVKRADGTLDSACVDSKSEAEQVVQSGVLPAQQAAEK